jgi:hypothetical protein
MPLLVSLLEQQQRHRNSEDDDRGNGTSADIQMCLSTGHNSFGDPECDDDPLRPLPSERPLQSSSSIRDESEEFDELEAELAQTMGRTQPPLTPSVGAAAKVSTSSPQKSLTSEDSSAPKERHLSSLRGGARLVLIYLLDSASFYLKVT